MSHKPARPNARTLSLEQEKEIKAKALTVLADLRRQMIYRYPFCGTISMSLELVPTRDPLITTAACDGKHVYFDIDFLAHLSPEHRLFVFAHEVWHAVLCHMLRCEGRDQNIWNIAADMEVNSLLRTDGLSVPSDALLPEKEGLPTGKNAETYYSTLLEQQKSKAQHNSNGGNGSGNGSSGKGSQNGDSGKQSPSTLGGNADGELKGQFDQHLSPSTNIAGMKRRDVEDKYGKMAPDADFQPGVTKENVELIREAAVSAAQQMERQRGSLPAHIKQLITELIKPEMPWQELLSEFVTKCMGEKTTWNKPARRFAASGTYLPSHYGEMVKIAVGIDTSGSIGRDLIKFLSELNGIVTAFGNYEIHLIECDCKVGKYEVYDESNPLDLEHTQYKATGGGGTRLMPIFDKIREEQLDIDTAIIFTDGYTEKFYHNDAPEFPVLWLLTTKGNEKNFEFGEVVHFADADK